MKPVYSGPVFLATVERVAALSRISATWPNSRDHNREVTALKSSMHHAHVDP